MQRPVTKPLPWRHQLSELRLRLLFIIEWVIKIAVISLLLVFFYFFWPWICCRQNSDWVWGLYYMDRLALTSYRYDVLTIHLYFAMLSGMFLQIEKISQINLAKRLVLYWTLFVRILNKNAFKIQKRREFLWFFFLRRGVAYYMVSIKCPDLLNILVWIVKQNS